jgi:hypothetical protein
MDIGGAARMRRRAWLVALCLYAVAVVADIAVHLREDRQLGAGTIGYSEVTVAFAAGLFWPADLIGRLLFRSGVYH